MKTLGLILAATFAAQLVAAGTFLTSSPQIPRPPVIIVPGDGGNQLEARINKEKVVHPRCNKKSNWFTIWINILDLLPGYVDCWIDNVRLEFDNVTKKASNSPGVEIRVPGVGETWSVEHLTKIPNALSVYMKLLVEALVAKGYVRGQNVRAMPLDFRLSFTDLADDLNHLRKMVVETYKINQEQKVTLICHSLGCPTTLYFLQQQDQKWKDQYIAQFITLGGPWGGSLKALKASVSGDNLGDFVVSPLLMGLAERYFPSTYVMVPNRHFWNHTEPVVTYINENGTVKNYSTTDYKEMYNDLNFTTGYDIYQHANEKLYDPLTPPGVKTQCLYGKGLDTTNRLIYLNQFPAPEPDVEYDDGDGTVSLRSLEGCKRWIGKNGKPVNIKTWELLDHMGLVKNKEIVDYVVSLIDN